MRPSVNQMKAAPEFGEYLRLIQGAFESYREKRGVSLPAAFIWLGAEIGMSVDQLRRTYAGESFPIRRSLAKILDAVGVPSETRAEVERLHAALGGRTPGA